jgi:flagellar hook protein FlgE
VEKAAGRIATAAEPASDTIDLSTEIAALIAGRNQFQSNARVIRTGDEMQKMLLDLLA